MLETARPLPKRRSFRFSLKALLASVLFLSLVFAWIAFENRKAQEQSALVAELSELGIAPYLREPTAVGFFVRKHFSGQEGRIRDFLGEGWLSRPTVLVCWDLGDDDAPTAVDKLKRLGTVREIHYQEGHVTEQALAELQSGLPGVGVVPRGDPTQQVYYRSKTGGEQFAMSLLVFEVSLLLILLGSLVAVLWIAISLVRHVRLRAKFA